MIKIAAVDSSIADKAAADVVCDGVNDQADINTALGAGNIEVFLFNGNYQIDAPIDLPDRGILRGNSEAGAQLNCNNSSAVLRSKSPTNARHEHVIVESLRVAVGTNSTLACDLRGFVRSQFNRIRITNFDLAVWFGGDESTYFASWTNVFSQFYLSENLIGFRFSGDSLSGATTANNITLAQGEIICKNATGAIAVDVIAGEITVESCDIGYADLSDGIVFHDRAGGSRVVNSRFEWDAQSSGKYPIKILSGAQDLFISGNIYTDACSRPNVYVQSPDSTRYLQMDAYAFAGAATSGSTVFNAGDFFRLDLKNEQVMVGDGATLEFYSDAYSTNQLELRASDGALVPKASVVTDGAATPTITVGAAAGTGGAATIFGSDTSGLVRFDTGTSPTTGTLFTINWATTKPTNHYTVVITAASSGSVVAMQRIYVDQGASTTTSVNVVATTALPASSFYKFYFHVLQY